jgi:predicted nucleic acid-binding Zn ribbon protein
MAYRDWKCPSCGYVLSDVPDHTGPHVCPNDQLLLEKVISAPNVLFRGYGWTPTFHKTEEKVK